VALEEQLLQMGANTSSEPIDLVTGAYLHETTDFSVGSAKFPYGLPSVPTLDETVWAKV
jgi:hypothetical protein